MNHELELLERLKDAFSLKTDTQLADFLEVRKETISTIRHGKAPFGEGLRLTVLDKMLVLDHVAAKLSDAKLFEQGAPRSSLVAQISADRLYKRLTKLGQDQHKHWSIPAPEAPAGFTIDALLLDAFIQFKAFRNDAESAAMIGVKRSSISSFRYGHSRLGHLPRLRIYREITGGDITRIEEAILSTEALLNLMQAE